MSIHINALVDEGRLIPFQDTKSYGVGHPGARPGGNFTFPFVGVNTAPSYRLAVFRTGMITRRMEVVDLQAQLLQLHLTDLAQYPKVKKEGLSVTEVIISIDKSYDVLRDFIRSLCLSIQRFTEEDLLELTDPERELSIGLLNYCEEHIRKSPETIDQILEVISSLKKTPQGKGINNVEQLIKTVKSDFLEHGKGFSPLISASLESINLLRSSFESTSVLESSSTTASSPKAQ